MLEQMWPLKYHVPEQVGQAELAQLAGAEGRVLLLYFGPIQGEGGSCQLA